MMSARFFRGNILLLHLPHVKKGVCDLFIYSGGLFWLEILILKCIYTMVGGTRYSYRGRVD